MSATLKQYEQYLRLTEDAFDVLEYAAGIGGIFIPWMGKLQSTIMKIDTAVDLAECAIEISEKWTKDMPLEVLMDKALPDLIDAGSEMVFKWGTYTFLSKFDKWICFGAIPDQWIGAISIGAHTLAHLFRENVHSYVKEELLGYAPEVTEANNGSPELRQSGPGFDELMYDLDEQIREAEDHNVSQREDEATFPQTMQKDVVDGALAAFPLFSLFSSVHEVITDHVGPYIPKEVERENMKHDGLSHE